MVHVTWSSSALSPSHVVLIVTSFALLTLLTMMIYLVFQMAAVVEVEAPRLLIRTH